MERDGLVTTGAAWGVATTHVQLTDEGQALAEAYVAALVRRRDDADMTAVAAG